MKNFMMIGLFIAALGFTACGNDDDQPSCASIEIRGEAAGEAYLAEPSEATCTELKAALQAYLDADCAEDAEDIADIESTIALLGDCTNGGGDSEDCVTCDAYEIQGSQVPATEVCKGENGNAFVLNIDTGIAFDTYIDTLEVVTTCN